MLLGDRRHLAARSAGAQVRRAAVATGRARPAHLAARAGQRAHDRRPDRPDLAARALPVHGARLVGHGRRLRARHGAARRGRGARDRGPLVDLHDERIAPFRQLAGGAGALLLAAAALAAAPDAVLVPLLMGGGVLAMSWNGLSFTAAAEISGGEQAGRRWACRTR